MLWKRLKSGKGGGELREGRDHEDAVGATRGGSQAKDQSTQQDQRGESWWNQGAETEWEQLWPKRGPGPRPPGPYRSTGRTESCPPGLLEDRDHWADSVTWGPSARHRAGIQLWGQLWSQCRETQSLTLERVTERLGKEQTTPARAELSVT